MKKLFVIGCFWLMLGGCVGLTPVSVALDAFNFVYHTVQLDDISDNVPIEDPQTEEE